FGDGLTVLIYGHNTIRMVDDYYISVSWCPICKNNRSTCYRFDWSSFRKSHINSKMFVFWAIILSDMSFYRSKQNDVYFGFGLFEKVIFILQSDFISQQRIFF